MSNEKNTQSVTKLGNPSKPQGAAGEEMLRRMGKSHSNVTDWALSQLSLNGSERILDIGCGGGDALKKMSARISKGSLTGVDYSPVSVELSRKNNISDIKSGKMQIKEASVEALPFPDNSFDVIYTIESFYFWGSQIENLKEIRRILTKNGIFMIIADIHGDAELTEDAIENIKKYNLFNPSTAQLRKLLESAGFKNVKLYTKDGTSWICTKAYK